MLHIVAVNGTSMELSNLSIQWFRIHPKESNKEIISGGVMFSFFFCLFVFCLQYMQSHDLHVKIRQLVLDAFITPSGATRPVYALEPHDVGRCVQAEINLDGEIAVAKTAGPIDPGLFYWTHFDKH
jgi:hypothetical protein